MTLNPRKGLKDLLTGRNKRSSSKETLKSQLLSSLPPSSPPTTGLLPIPNLKKKRKEQEVEQGEVVFQENKKQKMAQDKGWATLVESREDLGVVEVHQQHHTWAPRLELDNAAISWNSSIREFQRGHSSYVVEALE